MVKPIPDEIKEILAGLSTAQQVTMKGYIASLRSEIKDLESEVLTKSDPDPNAHYHGHEKCTTDHGHKDHDHHSHDHHKEHKHDHNDHPKEHKHDHKEHKHDHHEKHDHQDNKHKHHDCEGHDHKHGHDHEEEIPAWKKKALESDSDTASAPFGGNWNTETELNVKSDQMEE